MVHSRSDDAKHARLLRAIERKFLVPKPGGCSLILVPSNIADRMRLETKSMKFQRRHCQLANKNCHYAMSATLAARPLISDKEFKAARVCHKVAARARQNWEDMVDPKAIETVTPSSYPAAREGGEHGQYMAEITRDVVYENDPWASAAAVLLHKKTCNSDAHGPPLKPAAAEFAPGVDSSSTISLCSASACLGGAAPQQTLALEQLVHCQNSTISMLVSGSCSDSALQHAGTDAQGLAKLRAEVLDSVRDAHRSAFGDVKDMRVEKDKQLKDLLAASLTENTENTEKIAQSTISLVKKVRVNLETKLAEAVDLASRRMDRMDKAFAELDDRMRS